MLRSLCTYAHCTPHLSISRTQNPGDCSDWVQKRWPSWHNFAAALGLSALHLRKAALTKHMTDESHHKSDLAHRIVDFPSISTHLLIPLLCRWAFCSRHAGGLKADGERANSRDLLLALLRMMPEGQQQILMAPDAQWAPPSAPRSDSQMGGYDI